MPVLPRGYDNAHFDDVDETEETVSATPATLFGFTICNDHATAAAYVQFFDATAPTPGTTAPVLLIGIPPLDGKSQEFVGGITFRTAITVASTTTPTGATGTAVDDVSVSTFYLPGIVRSG